jgi:hypothetical protein
VPAKDQPHLRSFVCSLGHELRVTGRCLSEDLRDSSGASFDELANRHRIIRAFRRERSSATAGVDTLSPAGGERTLTLLRHSNDWRGVTWFDQDARVVWLCACGWHRSGQPDDAFPHFRALRLSSEIWPRDDDYEALLADRGEQFAAFVVTEAPQLLARARAAPDTEIVLVIGSEPVAIVVRVIETLEETFVAVSGLHLVPQLFQLLLVALYPDRRFEDWRLEQRLPTRELNRPLAEFCLSIVHG